MRRFTLLFVALLTTSPAVAYDDHPRTPPPAPTEAGYALLTEAYYQLLSVRAEQAEVRSLGLVDGYPLFFLHKPARSAHPVKVFVAAGVHGSEPGGVATALELIQWAIHSPEADPYDLTVVPVVNPWGVAFDWRRNEKDIDVNRSFTGGEPSEAARLLSDILKGQRFDAAIDLHGAKFKHGFFLIAAREEAAQFTEVLREVPPELLLPSTDGKYPSCAPAFDDPCRYRMLKPGAAVSLNEGTLKDFLANLGTPRSYTLEYPGQVENRLRATWNFRILRSLLASVRSGPPPAAGPSETAPAPGLPHGDQP